MIDEENEGPPENLIVEGKDGHQYTFTIELFTPKKGMKWMVRVIKMVGPGLASGEGSSQALAMALNGLDENTVEQLTDELASKTRVQIGEGGSWSRLRDSQGSNGTFNLVFAPTKLGGKGMMQWLMWAFQRQFSGFFDASALMGTFRGTHPNADSPKAE